MRIMFLTSKMLSNSGQQGVNHRMPQSKFYVSVLTKVITGVASLATVLSPLVANADASPQDSNPTYEWHVSSVGPSFTSAGPWNNGPVGWGPGILQFSQSISVSNGVTGQIYVSATEISGSVGWNVGTGYTYSVSYTESASYQVSVPSGRKYQIQWRNDNVCKNVYQQEYVVNHPGPTYPVGSPVTCIAYRWNNFEYRHVDVTNT